MLFVIVRHELSDGGRKSQGGYLSGIGGNYAAGNELRSIGR
jgi:hypothetical protein